jgi:hypothetical protein
MQNQFFLKMYIFISWCSNMPFLLV